VKTGRAPASPLRSDDGRLRIVAGT